MSKVDNTASAEERIKQAARKVFLQKGYAATRTRDIAAEADINLALLNYYFRSKEKLFDIIMLENIQQFVQCVLPIIDDRTTSLQQKIEGLVDRYIDMFLENPEMPLFVLTEIQSNPEKFLERAGNIRQVQSAFIIEQFKAVVQSNKLPFHPLHLLMNMIGMTAFPFAARKVLMHKFSIDKDAFKALMLERKKWIPIWVSSFLQPFNQ